MSVNVKPSEETVEAAKKPRPDPKYLRCGKPVLYAPCVSDLWVIMKLFMSNIDKYGH